ncbi:unnamed protein product, partial [Lampetra fluviatilis]
PPERASPTNGHPSPGLIRRVMASVRRKLLTSSPRHDKAASSEAVGGFSSFGPSVGFSLGRSRDSLQSSASSGSAYSCASGHTVDSSVDTQRTREDGEGGSLDRCRHVERPSRPPHRIRLSTVPHVLKRIGMEPLKHRRLVALARRPLAPHPPPPRTPPPVSAPGVPQEHTDTLMSNGFEELDMLKLLDADDLTKMRILDPEHRACLLTAAQLLQECEAQAPPTRSQATPLLTLAAQAAALPGQAPPLPAQATPFPAQAPPPGGWGPPRARPVHGASLPDFLEDEARHWEKLSQRKQHREVATSWGLVRDNAGNRSYPDGLSLGGAAGAGGGGGYYPPAHSSPALVPEPAVNFAVQREARLVELIPKKQQQQRQQRPLSGNLSEEDGRRELLCQSRRGGYGIPGNREPIRISGGFPDYPPGQIPYPGAEGHGRVPPGTPEDCGRREQQPPPRGGYANPANREPARLTAAVPDYPPGRVPDAHGAPRTAGKTGTTPGDDDDGRRQRLPPPAADRRGYGKPPGTAHADGHGAAWAAGGPAGMPEGRGSGRGGPPTPARKFSREGKPLDFGGNGDDGGDGSGGGYPADRRRMAAAAVVVGGGVPVGFSKEFSEELKHKLQQSLHHKVAAAAAAPAVVSTRLVPRMGTTVPVSEILADKHRSPAKSSHGGGKFCSIPSSRSATPLPQSQLTRPDAQAVKGAVRATYQALSSSPQQPALQPNRSIRPWPSAVG